MPAPGYKGENGGERRVVVIMTEAEVDALDGWGVPSGMPSRSAAIRELIRRGLEGASEKLNP